MRKHIALLLEGTYPYVTGGVGNWAHELIQRSSQYDFTVVAITDQPRVSKDVQYPMPPHVKRIVTIPLSGGGVSHRFQTLWERLFPQKTGSLAAFEKLPEALAQGRFSFFSELVRAFDASPWDQTLLRDPRMWKVIQDGYQKTSGKESLAHFLWATQSLFDTVTAVLSAPLPKADLYHSASTGYAGLLGAIGKTRHQTPFFLTEHGLYLQERQIEITFHKYLHGQQRMLMESFFELTSRWTYAAADRVSGLCESIRTRQQEYGAPEETSVVLPNGVDVDAFAAIPRAPHEGFHVGLVGRVVPIKDVKLLITAAQALRARIPDLRVSVIGPWDDPIYLEECRKLCLSLGVQDIVNFAGQRDPRDCYKDLDLMVLCSLKEVQPLAILEAMASGVPVVATRSGGVPELLGDVGIIIPSRDAGALVNAIRRVHGDVSLRERMIQRGLERVRAHYEMRNIMARYHEIYETLSQKQERIRWPASV